MLFLLYKNALVNVKIIEYFGIEFYIVGNFRTEILNTRLTLESIRGYSLVSALSDT